MCLKNLLYNKLLSITHLYIYTRYYICLLIESDGEETWELSDVEADEDDLVHAGVAPTPPVFEVENKEYLSAKSLLKWIVGFLLVLQARYHIPNSAIDLLIKFMLAIFSVLGCFSPFVCTLRKLLPSSLHVMRTHFASEITFSKYPVCPKCNKIYYTYESCIETVGDKKSSKRCNHIHFPNHPYQSMRSECNALLLKSVQFMSGRTILYPLKLYCYSGIKVALQKLLARPSFVRNCQLWKSRPVNHLLSEVYDGQVWKEFLNVAGLPFLAGPYTFGLMMNIDWFQPYDHTVCSVGVIYLTVINLPRTIRYKLENMLIVGIIPGPKEPHDINPFLEPLVCELEQFWSGIKLPVCTISGSAEEVVKCALLCVCCDLPAARKTCGFLSYNARLGCSKCMKEFQGSIIQRNYSGFDRSKWPPRTNSQHRKNVKKLKVCKTKTELAKNESLFGCRYSRLLDLPYFDPVRFLSIDPMHNLFLGTGKRILSLWIDCNLLNKTHFEEIQRFVDSMVVPSDVGRIPSKINSGFAGFKADQFKTWITIYSIPALHTILSNDHLECWRHFVLACRILCKHVLSNDDINLADALLLQFCKRVQRMYGENAITPNMHLHGHIKEVIQDYGPVQEFWCFSFERYNGILGKQPTNNRAIEPQLLQQFLLDNFSNSYDFPTEFQEDFASLRLNDFERSRVSGSLLENNSSESFIVPSTYKKCVFDVTDLELLTSLYSKLHPDHNDVKINKIHKKYSSITLNGRVYRSSGKSTTKPYVVLTSWNESYYGPPPTTLPEVTSKTCCNVRPVNIHHYMTISCTFSSAEKQDCRHDQFWTLAFVSWFEPHPSRYKIGKPAELWCRTLLECIHLCHSIFSYPDVLMDHIS